MKRKTNNPKIARRSARRRRNQSVHHATIEAGPRVDEHLDTTYGRSFIEGCLAAVASGDCGQISSTEDAANRRAITAASQRNLTTIIRLLDPAVAVAA